MKPLLVLIAGLLAVGCGKGGEITIGEPPVNTDEGKHDYGKQPAERPTPTDQNTTKAKPVKELTAEDKKALSEKVLGTYERIDSLGGFTVKQVFLENGKFESYVNGENSLMDGTWKIAGKEVYVERKVSPTNPLGTGIVFNIEPDGDLTVIAEVKYGKREDFPKEGQATYKKIK